MFDPASSADRLPRTVDVDPTKSVEVELAVGDSVQVGEVVCTVVEILDGEVHLRVDPAEGSEEAAETARFSAVAR
ncbi:hypothetical protein [Alienimonas chondri]|uniref:Lipoyl-binding domain-containing protein n=1 Tax=Alienimonas chondri TaxID=2681879 RepID=A0ABX1VAF0_9PLAN|nr:hypothetical protein [Alienimonas chondri]NNJ24485.1 hypothetical protein [Alienimonas chondri]